MLIHTIVVPYPMHSLGVRPFKDALPELLQTGGPELFQTGGPELFQAGGLDLLQRGVQRQGKIGPLIHTPDAAPACELARGY